MGTIVFHFGGDLFEIIRVNDGAEDDPARQKVINGIAEPGHIFRDPFHRPVLLRSPEKHDCRAFVNDAEQFLLLLQQPENAFFCRFFPGDIPSDDLHPAEYAVLHDGRPGHLQYRMPAVLCAETDLKPFDLVSPLQFSNGPADPFQIVSPQKLLRPFSIHLFGFISQNRPG